MKHLFTMAYRDLARNKRRSLLSALALGMGLALLLLMAAVVRGEMKDSIESNIRLQTGHMQIRAESYNEDKNSLEWKDLIEKPEDIIMKLASQPEVVQATPRILASGIINTIDESVAVKIIGMDPASGVNSPFQDGMLTGQYLQADDRDQMIIGSEMAKKYKLQVGSSIQLLANTADGDVNEQTFTVKGIFSTKVPAFDQSTILLPLAKAQAMTGTENHASVIMVLLKDREMADPLKARIQTSQYQVKTWLELNQFTMSFESYANSYMYLLYMIVLAVTATVIVNTLVMAVFERTREIGILSAVGMRSSSILNMFLIESGLLAILGIMMGIIIGSGLVLYANKVGFYIGNMGITGMMLGERIYGYMTITDAIPLIILALVVTLAASLYPAILASRMEPVEALHGGKLS
jgi:ABC-type lipoprotein release transport system permease subunit